MGFGLPAAMGVQLAYPKADVVREGKTLLENRSAKKKIVVLGSTGSIGQSTMSVVRDLSDSLKIVGLAACASTKSTDRDRDRDRDPDISQIAELIGCRPDEVAVCIEVNCEPDQYACTNRGDVKDMFKAGEFRH